MHILIHFSFEPDDDPDDSSSGSSEMEVDGKAPVKVENTVDDTVDDAVAVDENNNSTTQCKWGSTCFYFQCIYIYIYKLGACHKNIFLVAVPTTALADVLDTCSPEVRSAISQVLGMSEATKTEAKQPANDPAGNILSVFVVALVFGATNNFSCLFYFASFQSFLLLPKR